MNTILQKRIEEKAEELAQKYFPNEMNIWARQIYEAQYVESACKEIATFTLKNQWISVEEALPEENKLGDSDFVFVKTSIRFPFLACYSYKHETWKDINHVAIHGVTHWTPIQQLKGGEK